MTSVCLASGFRGLGEDTAVAIFGEETLVRVSVEYSEQPAAGPAWYEAASTIKEGETDRAESDVGSSTERPKQLDAMHQ